MAGSKRLVAVLAVVLAIVVPGSASARVCARPTAHDFVRLQLEYPRFRAELVRQFHKSWRAAAVVSFGEGSWHSWAANGCYRGTFQMGCRERRLYGHGPSLVEQVQAAARYWRRAHGFGPWDCKP